MIADYLSLIVSPSIAVFSESFIVAVQVPLYESAHWPHPT